jgi:hypothetical protein
MFPLAHGSDQHGHRDRPMVPMALTMGIGMAALGQIIIIS